MAQWDTLFPDDHAAALAAPPGSRSRLPSQIRMDPEMSGTAWCNWC